MIKRRSRDVVAVHFQKSCGAIGHSQWAAVQSRRRSKEVKSRKLMDARSPPVGALVCRRHDPFPGGDAIELAPSIACLDPIDATPPCIKRDVPRRRGFYLLC